jgi:hypothetical protein
MAEQGRSVLPSEEPGIQSGDGPIADENGLPLNVGDLVKGRFGKNKEKQQECCSKKSHVRFEGEIKSINHKQNFVNISVTKCANEQDEEEGVNLQIDRGSDIGSQFLIAQQTWRAARDTVQRLENKKRKFSEKEAHFKRKKDEVEAELVPLRTEMEGGKSALDELQQGVAMIPPDVLRDLRPPFWGNAGKERRVGGVEKIEPSVGTGAALLRSASTPDAAGGAVGAGSADSGRSVSGGGRKRRRRTKNKRKSKKKKYTKRRR